jgi:transcriptional regulator with XRE-family HTH domain
MNTERFSMFLRQRRKELGLTQEQLAEKLHVSTAAVSKWEVGKSLPDIAKIEDLAAALEVSVLEVLRGEKSAQALPDEPLKEVYAQTLHSANHQWRRKCAMILMELLLLLPYGFDWLVYRSPGQIDFHGADVLIGALVIVAAAAVFIVLKWSVGAVLLCHGVLLLIPAFIFFGWGRNQFAYYDTFAEHLVNKLPMATLAFWAAMVLPLVMGVIQLLCWEGEEK